MAWPPSSQRALAITDLARTIIRAVQNSMLGDLLMRLFPLVWFTGLISGAPHSSGSRDILYLVVLPGFAALLILTWLVGFLAAHRPSSGRGALERIQDGPANGFEAWEGLPSDGLRPPRMMRAIVMTLGWGGYPKSVWRRILATGAWLAATAVILAAGFRDTAFLRPISSILCGPGRADDLIWAAMGLMTALLIRDWAGHYRDILTDSANGN